MSAFPNYSTLDESADTARQLYQTKAGVDTSSWSEVVSGWKRAKGDLIAALNPATGRRVIPFVHELESHAHQSAWREALLAGAYTAATAAADAASRHCAEHKTDRTTDIRYLKATGRANSIATAHTHARAVAGMIDTESAALGAVGLGSQFLGIIGVRAGMKLSRAIGAYLREQGVSPDEASALVDAYSAAAMVRPRTGHIVLSANILDMLFCGDNCAYTSCHSLGGCFCAGPQAYLADESTFAVLYYEELRPWGGYQLPHKLFRQMGHIDPKHESAMLRRRYGQALPAAAHLTIRREVARLLCALRDGRPHEDEPTWTHVQGDGGAEITHDSKLPYHEDPIMGLVQLRGGQAYRPHPHVGIDPPCPSCGHDLGQCGSLVCESCKDGAKCFSCGDRVDSDDGREEDGDTYCDSCWSETYTSCERCSRTLAREGDNRNHLEDRGDYCERCYARVTSECAGCEERAHDDDLDHGYCPSCAEDMSECADCDDFCADDNLDADGRCESCAEKAEAAAQENLECARLYQRLLASPRFRRSFDGARCAMVRWWEYSTTGSNTWTWADFAAMETLEV